MKPLQIAGYLSEFGFLISFLANSFLIYLTVCHIKRIVGTFKRMILYFSVLGILFSGIDAITKPFSHNYRTYLLFFSASDLHLPPEFIKFLTMIWIGSYLVIIGFLAMQFFYRYLYFCTVNRHLMFEGRGTIAWIFYPIIPGLLYIPFLWIFCQPDEQSDNELRPIFSTNYDLNISLVPRFTLQLYYSNGHLNWSNLFVLSLAASLISSHYIIILICGLKIHKSIKTELKKLSAPQRKLQRQYFKALVVQCVGPTIFLIIPAGPVLLSLIFSRMINLDYASGWLFSSIGLYPIFDSISFMIIVAEYRKVIKKKFKFLFPRKSKPAVVNLQDLPRT